MGIEKISQKIIDDAEKEAKAIINIANKEAKKNIEKANDFIKIHKEKDLKKVKNALEIKMLRYIASANLETKKENLKSKRDFIDKLIDKTVEHITEDKLYEDFLKKRMDEAIIEDATIHMNASDYKIYKVLFEEMIKKSGYKSNISRDFVDIKGGFIIKKGKITIDCTLDSIIEAMYDEILMKINRMLVE